MNYKKKSPLLMYLLPWFTCGIYIFIWIKNTMKFINNFSKKEIFKVKRIIVFLLIFALIYHVLFFILFIDIFTNSIELSELLKKIIFFICFPMAVIWIMITIRYINKIGIEINNIIEENKMNIKFSKEIVVLLFFFYFIAIYYIQKTINKIIDNKT